MEAFSEFGCMFFEKLHFCAVCLAPKTAFFRPKSPFCVLLNGGKCCVPPKNNLPAERPSAFCLLQREKGDRVSGG